MKNKIVVLFMLLPLIALFTVASVVMTVSATLDVPVSSVEITTPTQDGVLYIDMATYAYDVALEVKVLPYYAARKSYKVEFSDVDGAERGEVEIRGDGIIVPRKAGSVKVTAISDDGGFRDSINVVVTASAAIDVEVTARDSKTDERYVVAPSQDGKSDFTTDVRTGKVVFDALCYPDYVAADVTFESGDGGEGFVVNPVTGEAAVLFAGEYTLKITMNPAVESKRVTTVKVRASAAADFTVNGFADDVVAEAEAGTDAVVLFAESATEPETGSALPEGVSSLSAESLGAGRWKVTVNFAEDFSVAGKDVTLALTAGGKSTNVTVRFVADLLKAVSRYSYGDGFIQRAGSVATYAAQSPFGTFADVGFEIISGTAEIVSAEGGTCRVRTTSTGESRLRVYGTSGSGEFFEDTVTVLAVEGYTSFTFTENARTWGIADRLAIGDTAWNGKEFVASPYELSFRAASKGSLFGFVEDAVWTSSAPETASVFSDGEHVFVDVHESGTVTFTVTWKYASAFNCNVKAVLSVDCVKDGVFVNDYASLMATTEAGRITVLSSNVKIGEYQFNSDGSLKVGAAEKLKSYVRYLPTTADWGYYDNLGYSHPEVAYCVEFKNDVYGNGYEINAENVTSVTPENAYSAAVFKGPLYFVSMNGAASVMAQDNIVFLVRTDGVVLDNVVLKGRDDESLVKDGKLALGYLRYSGTTLEIMSDCRVLNSRVSNGRTVLRVFGRDGIDLRGSDVNAEAERIEVSVESCIISNSAEFLVKAGTNRKVYGRYVATEGDKYDKEAIAPSLKAEGVTFVPRDDSNADSSLFRENFVLTYLTVKDSALSSSGAFCIGMESAFSGVMLDGAGIPLAGWKGLAGTSYSAVLKLVGNVAMYDWKPISSVDSSLLIETGRGLSDSDAYLRMDISAMLRKAMSTDSSYAALAKEVYGETYVHGGIAFYGGGKNYHVLDVSEYTGYVPTEYLINLSVLAQGETGLNNPLLLQGMMLPLAAGTEDFRFFVYDADCAFGPEQQTALLDSGKAYDFVVRAER